MRIPEMPLPTELFDYDLPEELIAQTPAESRDASRLMVVDRAHGTVEHRIFRELPDLIGGRFTLFRNVASVIPARLRARRPCGGAVECFLLRPAGAPDIWWCLLRPGRRLRAGTRFGREGAFEAEVLCGPGTGAARRVRFHLPPGTDLFALARAVGEVPLPPYIRRRHTAETEHFDRERYATVYANPTKCVAVAAPTAGLHFTPEVLARLGAAGARFVDLTLHVGMGTFKPISTPTVEEHPIHSEIYEVPAEARAALFSCAGSRLAVGTTTVRAIEDHLRKHDSPGEDGIIDEASLFLHPPMRFRGVDAMITNFHQPRSTLLCLVATFLTPGSTRGIGWIRELYAEAIARRYRFFSYGDAMLIL